ncbi:uncharacterized protein LOC133319582 [Danaus plexippus]|uniref:uncharacterized protein LOC133319582 n=1 Tax=Danaus plexippus TaxID=13037 RepID=UPI002AB1CC32|nr:uncharacterized protein LOC133319582 [Danaus plexippus]
MKVARLNETFPQAELRRLKQAEREAAQRAAETPEQSQDRRRQHAEYLASQRAAETPEQSQARRQQNAEYLASQRASETPEQSQDRRRQHAEYLASQRAAETPEQSQARRQQNAEYLASQRASETPEQSQARRLQQATYIGSQRATETVEAAEARRRAVAERAQQRRLIFTRNAWGVFDKAAFEYDETFDYESHKLIKIEAMNKECRFCGALKWKEEAAGFCPTFTIQGQIYHTIGSLLPAANTQPKFLQVYFMGDEEAQVDRRSEYVPGVERNTVQKIQKVLHDHNVLVHEFKMAKDRVTSDNYKVVIHPDRVPRGEHERRFNAPTTNEIAAVVVSTEQTASRDIVIQAHDGRLTRVPDTHRFYDALEYPIIFWKGQEGYSFDIPQTNPVTKQPIPNKKVSCKDFYAYHMMVRRNNFNLLLRCRLLLLQFLVDMYVKVESERLRFIALNQTKLRAENYIHLQDAVRNDADLDPNNLGQLVILPSSFVNSPRYLHEYTQDAFTYVRNYGRPDLFITMTCNPAWPEITKELIPGQNATDRHDLTARLFKIKVQKLVALLTKGKIFGDMKCFMYSIEWQKRVLPHVHLLLWLTEKLRPNQIDEVISAEIPNPESHRKLYDTVTKNMIHGPCGALNPSSPCMKEGKCTKKYPRALLKDTQTNDKGYPLYRRRTPGDGGRSDQAIFNIRQQGNVNIDPRDEVQTYRAGRYVSSNEAAWRILGLPLHERHPTVTHLAVHLPNGQRIYFTENNFRERMAAPPKTTLTAFFLLCQNDAFAKTLLYVDVPRYYTWNVSSKEWKRRLQGTPVDGWPGVKAGDALGRIYTVHVSNFECYCLRMLLNVVQDPTSFLDLKTVDGQELETFRQACEKLGLLEDDNHWDATIEEAVLCRSPSQIRELFAILICTCGLSNPLQLWDKYKSA